MPDKVNLSLLRPGDQVVFWEDNGDETECVLSFHVRQIAHIEVDPYGNTHVHLTPAD